MSAIDDSPATASRRNGKAASCEPCRKRKVRCDHQRPICGRCRKRGLSRQCFYHPAPLTKRVDLLDPAVDEPTQSFLDIGINGSRISPQPLVTDPSSHIATASVQPPDLGEGIESNDQKSHVQNIRDLLSPMRDISFIDQLVRRYYADTSAALVPGAFILPVSLDLRERYNHSTDHKCLHSELAEKICASTMRSIQISADDKASDFCLAIHGENLRLEMLGLMYTVAARSSMYGLVNDHGRDRGAFAEEMFRCSNEALRLSRDLTPQSSDLLVWLQYENLLLTTALHGDAAFASWRRLGELASDLLALDLHRESACSSVPTFLAECRRRAYAASYHLDKLLATVIDRPPRILKRFSDFKMPLDLIESELLTSDADEIDRYRQNLTIDGWSIERRYSPATWARLRYIAALFREEILEFPFRSSSAENIAKLKNLRERCHEQARALPPHCHYTPDIWYSGLRDSHAFMLTTTYLSYRQLDFQIYRVLEKDDSEAFGPLLKAAEDIVTTVIHVGTLRTRASFLAHDFEFLILVYGLPSVAVLASALERVAMSGGRTLPASLSRSALIKNLCVFVSMLESLHGLGDAKKSLCVESAKAISRILDKALDSEDNSIANDSADTALGFPSDHPPRGLDPPLANGPSGLDVLVSCIDAPLPQDDALDSVDLANWTNNIDWATIGGDWMAF